MALLFPPISAILRRIIAIRDLRLHIYICISCAINGCSLFINKQVFSFMIIFAHVILDT